MTIRSYSRLYPAALDDHSVVETAEEDSLSLSLSLCELSTGKKNRTPPDTYVTYGAISDIGLPIQRLAPMISNCSGLCLSR